MLDQPAKQTEFAELIGIKQQSVGAHVKNGTLIKGETNRQWLLAYCQRLRLEAAGRDQTDEMKQATIRLNNAKAKKTELETDILLKTVVDIDEVYEELQPAIEHMKSVLNSSVEKIRSSLEAAHEIKVSKRFIEDPIFNALSEIAKYQTECETADNDIDGDVKAAA